MCGICGQFNFKSNMPVQKNKIHLMAGTMQHRGPDDEGYYFNNEIGLGFRRLSIIDLAAGHQPMTDNDQKIWVVFNGEIYNFHDLRNQLKDYGYEFRTESDTEVIVAGYKKWGEDVLRYLNGMFGLAIWDEESKKLVIARDRMGIKIVYYTVHNGGITFCSEIKPILKIQANHPGVHTEGIYLFLRYRYTPSPYTAFNDINKLAPGTKLVAQRGKIEISNYWEHKPHNLNTQVKINDVQQELLEIYKNAVKRHLISDVPLGLLLSGGVDSGLLLSLMNLFGDKWKTFTVGYGDSYADDELVYASDTAQLFNAVHHEVRLDVKQFEDTMGKIVEYLEEPIASSSIIPMYHICELSSKKVKVALVGQGPDELFGGYTRHIGIRYGHIWRKQPEFIRAKIKKVLSQSKNEALSRSAYSLDTENRVQRYQHVLSLLDEQEMFNLFKDGIIEHQAGDMIIDSWGNWYDLLQNIDELGGFQLFEIRSTLPDELLLYADKLSMIHSLELRVPYLDKEIVEFVECLPSAYKVNLRGRKYLHKCVAKQLLPREIIKRKKRGFAVDVVDEWFKKSLSKKMEAVFIDPKSLIYNYLKKEEVLKLLHSHRVGERNYHKVLFSIAVLEEWLRCYSPS